MKIQFQRDAKHPETTFYWSAWSRKNKRIVTLNEFEEAKDKVMMGSERRSMVMSEEEKTLTAYHEAGHAIATIHSPASDPIHKATI